VANQGTADAGPFAIVFNGFPLIQVGGLAAGQSVMLTYTSGCAGGTHTAVVDALSQVAESDETNNTASIDVIC
jgi:subtilase family serine protease